MARRYEWTRPGALIHIDTARLARFGQPGHRARGRAGVRIHANHGLGSTFVHVAVDDLSRYAYVEQHCNFTTRYVALLRQERLDRVVDRMDLAVRLAERG